MRIDEVAPSKMDVDLVIKDFGKFLQLCMKELDLPKLPKIKWITDGSHHKKFHSFGSFHNDDQVLYIEITDRHPIDIMRTTAHELVHYKQYLDNRIKPNSGETGSEIENEANAVAGIIMRHFDGANPKAFNLKPLDAALMEGEAWQKAAGKNPEGGLNKKGVASYRRSHPGSKLQTAVTTKPSKLKKGSKASKRRKSFCARMKGMKKHRTGAKTAHDPNSRINKSLRKWNCESIEEMRDMILTAEAYIAEEKQRLDAKCWKGYRKAGTKMKGGIRVNNCVPNESVVKEFAADEQPERGDGRPEFMEWQDFIAAVANLTKSAFDAKVGFMNKKLDKKQAVAKFIPHDPYEHGPVMLYAYKDSRPPHRIGIKANIQVGTYTKSGEQTITQYKIPTNNLRSVNMTPANATMVAHAIMKNTAGALTEAANPAQQAAIAIAKKKKKEVSEDIATKLKDLYHHLRYTAGGDEEHKYKKSKYQGKGKPETDQDPYKGMSDFERGHTIRARSSDADHAREFIARRDNPRIDWPSEVDENFADGKGPGRPGDSARHGIPKHATMSELEKASHAKGRKGQLARWQMNMRNGKKK